MTCRRKWRRPVTFAGVCRLRRLMFAVSDGHCTADLVLQSRQAQVNELLCAVNGTAAAGDLHVLPDDAVLLRGGVRDGDGGAALADQLVHVRTTPADDPANFVFRHRQALHNGDTIICGGRGSGGDNFSRGNNAGSGGVPVLAAVLHFVTTSGSDDKPVKYDDEKEEQ
jgi:hypothetical protein